MALQRGIVQLLYSRSWDTPSLYDLCDRIGEMNNPAATGNARRVWAALRDVVVASASMDDAQQVNLAKSLSVDDAMALATTAGGIGFLVNRVGVEVGRDVMRMMHNTIINLHFTDAPVIRAARPATTTNAVVQPLKTRRMRLRKTES